MQTRAVAAVSAAAFAAVLSVTAANAANIEITNVGFIGDATDLSGFVNATGVDTGIILLTTTGGTIIPVFCIDLFHDVIIGHRARRLNTPPGRSLRTHRQIRPAPAAIRFRPSWRAKSRPW
jgi:hypothetical protein